MGFLAYFRPLLETKMALEKLVVGLTGNIASGKSTVTKTMDNLGAYVIDADKVGHKLYEDDAVLRNEIVKLFGSSVLDKDSKINRKELGKIVFGDKNEMNRLTSLVWPYMGLKINKKIKDNSGIIVLEAAVLYEAGWEKNVDYTLVVAVDDDLRIKRLIEREKRVKGYDLSETEAKERIAAQVSQEEKIKKADYVIYNNSTKEDLEKETKKLWQEFNTLYSKLKSL
jgi:dephospho-CoA kinase